jgi:hypothetical protein
MGGTLPLARLLLVPLWPSRQSNRRCVPLIKVHLRLLCNERHALPRATDCGMFPYMSSADEIAFNFTCGRSV